MDRFALRIEYQAICKPRRPFLWGYCGEALAEEVENGLPVSKGIHVGHPCVQNTRVFVPLARACVNPSYGGE